MILKSNYEQLTDWFVEVRISINFRKLARRLAQLHIVSQRRSLAGSLIFGGGGLGGAVFPVLMERLLVTTGFRWTLRAWSVILLVLGGIAIMGTKPRVPIAPNSRPAPLPPIDLKFAASPLFVAVVRSYVGSTRRCD